MESSSCFFSGYIRKNAPENPIPGVKIFVGATIIEFVLYFSPIPCCPASEMHICTTCICMILLFVFLSIQCCPMLRGQAIWNAAVGCWKLEPANIGKHLHPLCLYYIQCIYIGICVQCMVRWWKGYKIRWKGVENFVSITFKSPHKRLPPKTYLVCNCICIFDLLTVTLFKGWSTFT